MIYIFTALYCEAHPLVQNWKLKQNHEIRNFKVFENEEKHMILTVTGVGSVAAATAVGSICMKYGAGKGDFLINVGICAGRQAESKEQSISGTSDTGIYLCNKITEAGTGRTFYPDMLYRHDFVENEVTTVLKPIQSREEFQKTGKTKEAKGLYDMEAAAMYQAGAHFVGPHQMSFIKIVSDSGEADKVTEQMTENYISRHLLMIVQHVNRLMEIEKESDENQTEDREEEWLDKVCEDMHCSVVMKNAMKQRVRYCRLAGIEYKGILEEGYRQGKLPCAGKREGKLYFEEFCKQLF